jgi:hypothetical protein
MGLSVPASLASIAATLALGGGAAAPYEPLPPPLPNASAAEKPAAPPKPAEAPAPKTDANGYRPYQPLPPPLPKASSATKPASPPAKPATPPAPSAGAKANAPYQPLPPPPAKASAAKPVAPPKTAAPAKAATGKTGAPPAAPAATTVYVIRRTEDSWTVMDPAAVEKVAGGPIRKTYSVVVRRNLLNGGPPQPGYVRTLNEFDCEAYKFRWRTFTIYNRFGAVVVKQDNADPAFKPLERGSDEEAIFKTVCDGAGGGSVVSAPSLGLLVIGLMQGWDEAAMTSALTQLPPAPPPIVKPVPRKKAR